MSIEYKCKNCTKTYTTYKSLWRHNSLKHNSDVSENVSNVSKISKVVSNNVSNVSQKNQMK